MNRRLLSLPTKRPDRGSFRLEPGMQYRILLKPAGRWDRRRYYAANSDGMFWTEFREVAESITGQNAAFGIMARIISNNARLRDRISVVPA